MTLDRYGVCHRCCGRVDLATAVHDIQGPRHINCNTPKVWSWPRRQSVRELYNSADAKKDPYSDPVRDGD
jgi:hypothetical protein